MAAVVWRSLARRSSARAFAPTLYLSVTRRFLLTTGGAEYTGGADYTVGGTGDTIFAPASGGLKAGISIVRISGPDALSVLTSHRGLLDDGRSSFTGEPSVELHLHGGRAVVRSVLDALGRLPYCRVAQPGEFTRRAFRNGKLDLTQVEGLADLLNADTEAQRQQALSQMNGSLQQLYQSWATTLLSTLAHIEANIDFGEDEDDCDTKILQPALQRASLLCNTIAAHLNDGHRGEIIRDGVRVAIIGPPNAGKSSLLNFLAQKPAAIVSDTPGTTRDLIEVQLDVGGVAVTLCDTAGLRTGSCDGIELEGMSRAKAFAGTAHLVICLMDVSTWPTGLSGDIAQLLGASSMLVLNKVDVFPRLRANEVAAAVVRAQAVHTHSNAVQPPREGSGGIGVAAAEALPPPVHFISCHTGEGLPQLYQGIERAVHRLSGSVEDGSPIITRQRHRQLLQECVRHLQDLQSDRLALDASAEHLRLAARSLGRITGRFGVEDVLDVIFRDFCIGK